MQSIWHGRLAAGVAAAVPPSESCVRPAGSRRDRPGHRACAHLRDSRARAHRAGGARAEGRSQRPATDGCGGRSRRVPISAGGGACGEPDPLVLQIQQLPSDLAPWDLEDHAGVRDLLCELGHHGPLSCDAHLRLLAERCGVALLPFRRRPRSLRKAQTPSLRNILNSRSIGCEYARPIASSVVRRMSYR